MPSLMFFVVPPWHGAGSSPVFFSLARALLLAGARVACVAPRSLSFASRCGSLRRLPLQDFDDGAFGSLPNDPVPVLPDDAPADELASALERAGAAGLVLHSAALPPPRALLRAGRSLAMFLAPPAAQALADAGRLRDPWAAAGAADARIIVPWRHPALRPSFAAARDALRAPVDDLDADLADLLACEEEGRLLVQRAGARSADRRVEGLARALNEWLGATGADSRAIDESALVDQVTARLWARPGAATAEAAEIAARVDAELGAVLRLRAAAADSALLERARASVIDNLSGLGPLEKFRRDPAVTEIMVNGHDAIYVERDGRMALTGERFAGEAHLRSVIDRVVGEMGRRVDTASPLCDVRLRDGSRVNVVLPPVSVDGPVMTVRRFRSSVRTIEDLAGAGALTAGDAAVLAAAVREKKNIVVAGNAGAGKTTLLGALSAFIGDGERVVTIEDAAELQIRRPHVVRLEARPRNAEGHGGVGIGELVVNALRMRPDRIVVGECRGAEAVPMLQAMNTGHDGSMTTLHANSAQDALRRLESMILLGAPEWPAEVARQQIAAALDLIVYLKRDDGGRRLTEIARVEFEGGALRALDARPS